MGSSAGTGVRSFAEGGSTSTPTGDASAAPSRQIYQAQYDDYGLGSTPQAQGRLASILNMGNYGNQMPTFTRPQAPPPQAQQYSNYGNQMPTFTRPQAPPPQPTYRVPYGPSIPQDGGMFGRRSAVDPNLAAINEAFASPKEPRFKGQDYEPSPVYMDRARRNAILKNPGAYLEYAQYIQGGGDPSKFSRKPQPIQYMTQGQRDAMTKSQRRQLKSILPPSAPEDSGGGD